MTLGRLGPREIELGDAAGRQTDSEAVNGGEKVGHVAAQNQASCWAPRAKARALIT